MSLVLFTHLGSVNIILPNGFLGTKMGFFSSSLFVSFSSLLVTLFGVLHKVLFRFISVDNSRMNSPCCSNAIPKESPVEKEATSEDESSSEIKGFEEFSKDEGFVFTFKFPSFEEFRKNQTEKDDFPSSSDQNNLSSSNEEQQPTSLLNKYDFQSPTHSSFFVDKSQSSSFVVTELYSKPDDDKDLQSGFLAERDFREEISEPELESKTSVHDKENREKEENSPAEIDDSDSDSDSDLDSDSVTSSREFSFMSPFISSTSDDFLSDADFEAEQKNRVTNDSDFEEDEDILAELREMEKDLTQKDDSAKMSNENQSSASSSSSSSSGCDSEDSNALETLWEHQDLLEQIKMELKKVRATGLPTIMEDSSECPKMSDDLKPWKIDEKVHRGERLSELHRFYKSYRERMRKFDILNYQKMYALGYFQSKDPFQSFSSRKSSTIWGCKSKKPHSDQMVKFVTELQGDLEMVYVGQLCLSWEFLQWQYEKAFEIWESDPHGFRQYNEVAGEFQQFQVLLQRFIENEPFQGPRVENYVKIRCVMRNLLQVPVIREDSKETKKARRGRDTDAITSDMLFEILEESIRTIWRFIKADKNAHTMARKSRRGKQVELQDPADSDLFVGLQTELQKKDKRLKELLRSGNCILKKFRKDQEDGTDHLHFFSQVEMKLVARVLNMSKITTEQLVWCHNKLTKINFVKRKIHVEPSFLLFPC